MPVLETPGYFDIDDIFLISIQEIYELKVSKICNKIV